MYTIVHALISNTLISNTLINVIDNILAFYIYKTYIIYMIFFPFV